MALDKMRREPKPSPASTVSALIRKKPKHPNAKTFTDSKGNVREIGGKIVKEAPTSKPFIGSNGKPITKRG